MKRVWYLLLASCVIVISCRKNDHPAPPATTATKEDLLRDSVYLYTKEVYLWQDVIPAYNQFNPRQYKGATELESAQNVMDAIRTLQALDRFSFVTKLEEYDVLQSIDDKDY